MFCILALINEQCQKFIFVSVRVYFTQKINYKNLR